LIAYSIPKDDGKKAPGCFISVFKKKAANQLPYNGYVLLEAFALRMPRSVRLALRMP
jgi:hypothetical protein